MNYELRDRKRLSVVSTSKDLRQENHAKIICQLFFQVNCQNLIDKNKLP